MVVWGGGGQVLERSPTGTNPEPPPGEVAVHHCSAWQQDLLQMTVFEPNQILILNHLCQLCNNYFALEYCYILLD